MAIMQRARQELIKPDRNDPRMTARMGILHVDAGNAKDLHNLFVGNQRPGGSKIESHFFIPKTGPTIQYRDTAFEADANFDANAFALSFETQGFGAGTWNRHQLDEIKEAMLWCRTHHAIPLRVVDTWNDHKGGWGYHTLFGAPSHWTPIAKSCPGPERKQQFHDILVPWMRTVDKNATGGHAMNTVEKWRAGIEKVNKQYPIPTDRVEAKKMQDAVKRELKEGPKS